MIFIPTKIKSPSLVKKRRTQIIRSAIELFARKGYHKTTLKELAEETGISYGNIYDYVGSKEDILFLIHEFINDVSHEIINRNMEGVLDPLERLRRLICAEIEILYTWNDAILLLYRETHMLMDHRDYLNKIFQEEREHHERFEIVIKGCIDAGYFPTLNIRLFANLIKIMCESCVLKRWDLKGHIVQSELATSIINMTFHGLLQCKTPEFKKQKSANRMLGKSLLIINTETLVGKAMIPFLLSKGFRLAIHSDGVITQENYSFYNPSGPNAIKYYSTEEYGPMSVDLFNNIVSEFGSIDVVIQDLGTGILGEKINSKLAAHILDSNFRFAQDFATYLESGTAKTDVNRILYLAPWAWDSFANSFKYEMVKSGTVNLTQNLAKRMATSKVNVNCIVPGFIGGENGQGKYSKRHAELIEQINKGSKIELLDILSIVYFLISEESKSLTGQILEVI